MKASELRIGNLVNVKFFDELIPTKIDGILLTNEVFVTVKDELHVKRKLGVNDQIIPIPLTEEWLLKFGFVYCESKFWDKPNIMTIQISNNESLDYEDNEFFIAGVSSHRVVTLWKSPIYIHQLQNLYFALTGEELIVRTSVV